MVRFPRALEGGGPSISPEAFSMPAATKESCPWLGTLVETKLSASKVLTLQLGKLRKDTGFNYPGKNSKISLQRKCSREKPSNQVEVVTQLVRNNENLDMDTLSA